jgi:hypothetical protein
VVAVSTDSPRFHPGLTVGEAFALHPGARAVFANFHLPLEMIMDALNALPDISPAIPAEKAS